MLFLCYVAIMTFIAVIHKKYYMSVRIRDSLVYDNHSKIPPHCKVIVKYFKILHPSLFMISLFSCDLYLSKT